MYSNTYLWLLSISIFSLSDLIAVTGIAKTSNQLNQDRGNSHRVQKECKLEGLHPLLIVTYKSIALSVDKITVPHGDKVTLRCRELGKYKLAGDSLLDCRNGSWNGRVPSCLPTTAISNYSENVPPTIIFGLPAGSAAIDPSGSLVVFPGSILHLECLFARRLGNPEWTWTSNFRQYLTGWAIAPTERDWKYRLSIYYAKTQDSGVYACSTPRGLMNSINVRVMDVHCPPLTSAPAVVPVPVPTVLTEDGLTNPLLYSKVEGTRLGQTALFECPVGYRLEGARGITCQYNGKWSAEMPRCEPILCPVVQPNSPKLQVLEHNNSFGGRAVFGCMWGFELVGDQSIFCQDNGLWNSSVPICIEITCPSFPNPPMKSGRIRLTGKKRSRHKVGSLLEFYCLPGHELIGEPFVICTENGTWSHRPPLCKVRCPYPGDPPHGIISPLKFWYKPGDSIRVTCSPGYITTPIETSRKQPICQENGMWSAPPPPCRSYRDVPI